MRGFAVHSRELNYYNVCRLRHGRTLKRIEVLYKSYLEFLCELVCNHCGEAREEWCKEHTNITHINGDMEEVQSMIKDSRSHHQS